MSPLVISLIYLAIFVDAGRTYEEKASFDAGHVRMAKRSECPRKYVKLTPDHTMCKKDIGTESRLTIADKQIIVNLHNDFRRNVVPSAQDMVQLRWDDKLAIVAGKWARQCSVEEEQSHARALPEYPDVYIGQNRAYDSPSFISAIGAWYNQWSNFKYGEGIINPQKPVSGYVQMVFAMTSRIGCGYAICGNGQYRRIFVCNYAPGLVGESRLAYKNGTSCAACPNSCSDKLCNCSSRLCYHFGDLDINTCRCVCRSIYFYGDNCELDSFRCNRKVCRQSERLAEDTCKCEVDCRKPEFKLCKAWPTSSCEFEFIKESCPKRCGSC